MARASATIDTTNAANIATGKLPAARLPAPTTAAAGGVISALAPSNQFATGIDTTGTPTFAQPAFSNLAGVIAPAQVPSGLALDAPVFTGIPKTPGFTGYLYGNGGTGWTASSGAQIYMGSPVFTAAFLGNTITCTSTNCTGIAATSAGVGLQVIGNYFNAFPTPGTNLTGIASNFTNGTIVGNVFSDLALGFNLTSSSSQHKTIANTFKNVTTQYLNNGTNNSVGVATP